MEILPKPRMGGNGAGDVSNKVTKIAALGFRVKSGWAAAVMLSGSPVSPELRDVRRIELSDPQLPETQQPYHASMGKLETDAKKITRRIALITKLTRRSVATLLANYEQSGHTIRHAGIVVGSQNDPVSIMNPHIRAHAFEGQFFRSVLEQALQERGIRTEILLEREAYARAAIQLNRSQQELRYVIQNFGRRTEGRWRADEKLAALAAWLALN